MKKTLLLIVLIAGVISIGLRDQFGGWDDDPNVDQIPAKYREYAASQQTDNSGNTQVITDADGYDEFYLGNAFAEPHISMNPNDNKQLFAAYNTNATWRTMDGLDWDVVNPSIPGAAGDPVTAFDSLGRLYYDNMYAPGGSIIGTKLAYSDNNGNNWLSIVDANVGYDKNWIAADQSAGPYTNYVYGVMSGGTVVRSTNRGQSFQSVGFYTNTLPGMMVAVGPNGATQGGSVYVVASTGNSFAPQWTFYRSTDGGTTWELRSTQFYGNAVGDAVNGRNSVQNMRTRPYPFIAADNSYGPNRGRLYLIYASNFPQGAGNKPDIWCRWSDDGGSNWSAEVKINDDANSEVHNQWFPSIWCDKINGRVYVKWLDTRDTPTSDSALVYGSYTSNGGQTWVTNKRLSSKKFRINCTTCGGGGTPAYLGDYDALMSAGSSAGIIYTDFRFGNFASFFLYYPDYAMKVSSNQVGVPSGGNSSVEVQIPSSKDYTGNVVLSASVVSPPGTGTISLTWAGGNNTITTIPGNATLNISASANVPSGAYTIEIVGRGTNGIPAHKRSVTLLVNSSVVKVRTNRPGVINFTVNGTNYNQPQEFVVPNGNQIQISTPAELTTGSTRYTWNNWSNGGAISQNITVNSNLDLVANYKVGYRLVVNSTYGTTTGNNTYFDSGGVVWWSVSPRIFNNSGTLYYFRGWNGTGPNSYTSADSSGRDTITGLPAMLNPFVETARWSTTPASISNISSELPTEYKMYQNYPNPFNPETKIKFDLIRAGNVKVIVYDLLGKEVEILANQLATPGRYEVTFNGRGLASGIYYYKIITDEFVDIKKMMLIK
ncbi:MAG: T9SS type A sorting domain-containing protein [Ignavibacteria bacterium]|nr:T9SS type A sorting domain-containing protein [Ignavibacteria bacterium]